MWSTYTYNLYGRVYTGVPQILRVPDFILFSLQWCKSNNPVKGTILNSLNVDRFLGRQHVTYCFSRCWAAAAAAKALSEPHIHKGTSPHPVTHWASKLCCRLGL